jgi:hypothetical protein
MAFVVRRCVAGVGNQLLSLRLVAGWSKGECFSSIVSHANRYMQGDGDGITWLRIRTLFYSSTQQVTFTQITCESYCFNTKLFSRFLLARASGKTPGGKNFR